MGSSSKKSPILVDGHAEPTKAERKPSGKIVYMFLYLGIVALVSSIIFDSSTLAFIGLGLVLWGALFFYARPVEYMRKEVLEATVLPPLISIGRILNELGYEGNPIHLPPRSLKELNEPILFIPKKGTYVPHSEESSGQKARFDSEGISIVDLGQGLLNVYENELGTDFAGKDLDYLRRELPKLLVENLELVDHIEINTEDDTVFVRIDGSVYRNLCKELGKQKVSGSLLGCPLCNSIACALAKVTDRAVMMEKREFSPDEKTVEALFRLVDVQRHFPH